MSASEGGPRVVRRHPTAPAHIRWIVRTLEEAGHETWAVGGAVRDVLHGVESVDWDLATRARPDQVRRLFRRTVPIGVEHGTVGVLTRSGTLVEVTTFRRDVETFGRHAVVEFADTVDEDLARRDFTVNAVAWHPLRDKLHDPFDGVEDLERGVLRTVGEPDERFAEDYLRVLRALRFAGRFQLRVDPGTWSALVRAVEHLDVLSPERIRDELMKVLEKDPAPSGALGLWAASGALERVAPEVAALVDLAEATKPTGTEPSEWAEVAGPDPWARTCLSVDALPPHRPLVRLSALLADVGRPPDGRARSDPSSVPEGEGGRGVGSGGAVEVVARRNGFAGAAEAERGRRRAAAILTRLRFSNAESDRVAGNVAAGPQPPEVTTGAERRRWLARTGPERLPDLTRVWGARARVGGADAAPRRVVEVVRRLRAELASGVPLTTGDLALDGRDLIRMGMKPGPVFGEILETLLDRVLEDPELNRKHLLAGMVEEEWVEEGRTR